MSEFVKPTRVEVDISDDVKDFLGRRLIKDIHGNETICPICKGTGVRIARNPYGLSDDPDKKAGMFPYLHESISFCPNCYNGIVHYCPDCGKQLPRGSLKCNCEAEQKRRRDALRQKEQKELEKAEKYDFLALGDKFQVCYSDYYDRNDGYFSDWDEFFDNWSEQYEDSAPRPEYVWGTSETEMSFDAYDIVSSACEDLYEDAINDIGQKAIDEMQDFLNKWKEKYGLLSYCETHKCAVKIPWGQYDVLH